VQNFGSASAPTAFVRYYLSSNATFDADNTVVECDENNNIIVFGPLP
jgi:hypothetical protein